MSDNEIFDDRNDLSHLGAQIRELREAQGLSYDDVATSTHVRPHILRAIEEGRVSSEITAPVYMRGFIKTYCEFLKADDLWKKYSTRLLTSMSSHDPSGGDAGSDYTMPRPMFRRSSIVWVYFVIVIAVFGAIYMVWNQQKGGGEDSGFFLRSSADKEPKSVDASETAAAEAPKADPVAASEDEAPRLFGVHPTSGDTPVSADTVIVPPERSVDLSWLDSDQPQQKTLQDIAPVRSQIPDQRLLIRTTKPVRLTVQQKGEILTRRNMPADGVRSYDVTVETPVELSVGDAAEVTWYGRKYAPVGSGDAPLSLTFYPDGTVRVERGRTVHFGPGAAER